MICKPAPPPFSPRTQVPHGVYLTGNFVWYNGGGGIFHINLVGAEYSGVESA